MSLTLTFEWNLEILHATSLPAIPPLLFRSATQQEKSDCLRAALHGFSWETAWTSDSSKLTCHLNASIEHAFSSENPSVLVILHGNRIIGVSVLSFCDKSAFHLLSGPCILEEYRNRCLGSALLEHSLHILAQAGLKRARGCTRPRTVAAKYVYPKFASIVLEQKNSPEFAPTAAH